MPSSCLSSLSFLLLANGPAILQNDPILSKCTLKSIEQHGWEEEEGESLRRGWARLTRSMVRPLRTRSETLCFHCVKARAIVWLLTREITLHAMLLARRASAAGEGIISRERQTHACVLSMCVEHVRRALSGRKCSWMTLDEQLALIGSYKFRTSSCNFTHDGVC